MVLALKFSNREDCDDDEPAVEVSFLSAPEQPVSPIPRASTAIAETATRDITFPRFAAFSSTHAHLAHSP
jgi:hypothetical protein